MRNEGKTVNWNDEPPAVMGRKNDSGKLRWDLLPTDSLRELVRVLTFGANKYEDRNWEKGMDWGRCYAAALRHLTSWWDREEDDPESGISHLAHTLCCVVFLLSYKLRGVGNDNRPTASKVGSSVSSSSEGGFDVE